MTAHVIDLDVTPVSLEEILAYLEQKPEIVLKRGDVTLASIKAAEVSKPRPRFILGLHAGEGWISDDFTAELPDSFWDSSATQAAR